MRHRPRVLITASDPTVIRMLEEAGAQVIVTDRPRPMERPKVEELIRAVAPAPVAQDKAWYRRFERKTRY